MLLADVVPSASALSPSSGPLLFAGLLALGYFLLRKRVVDRYGQEATVVRECQSLSEALGQNEAEAKKWLAMQKIKPKTPVNGIWYVVSYDNGGEGVCGSLDCSKI